LGHTISVSYNDPGWNFDQVRLHLEKVTAWEVSEGQFKPKALPYIKGDPADLAWRFIRVRNRSNDRALGLDLAHK
jgi:hypothetical protein